MKNRKCYYCDKRGHISKACWKRKKDEESQGESVKQVKDESQTRNTNPVSLDEEELSEQVHFIHQVTDDSSIGEAIGIDSQATISVLSDAIHFISWKEETKTLYSYDHTKRENVRSGTARFILTDQNGQNAIEMLLDAAYIPGGANVICMFDLLQCEASVLTNLDAPTLTKDNSTIRLKWQHKLLQGAYLKPVRNTIAKVSYEMWHNRLGHPGTEALKKMLDIDKPDSFTCFTCQQVKRKEKNPITSPYKRGYVLNLKPYEHLQMDIFYHPVTRNNTNSSLVIIDMHSRYTYVCELTAEKTEVIVQALRDFIIYAQVKPRRITTDRAPCFASSAFSSWCNKNCIDLQFCSPNKHQGNGYAERVIQTIRNKALAMLNHSKLSSDFYFDAVDYATMIYNRTHHSILKCSPYEKLNRKDLDIKHFNRFLTFGATIFYERNGKGIFLGCCKSSTTATVKILSMKRRIVRRNLLSITADETFMSRYMLSTLEKYFRNDNSILDIEQDNSTGEVHIIRSLIEAKDELLEVPEHLSDVPNTKSPNIWLEAAKSEVARLRDFKTFKLISRGKVPHGVKILPARFVFAKKRDGRTTARLVAGGHRQVGTLFGTYFGSPTSTSLSLKIYLLICTFYQLVIIAVDFKGAYLNAELDTQLYLYLPKNFELLNLYDPNMVMALNKSIYGLKESGRLWYECINNLLKKLGFTRSMFDPCIYFNLNTKIFILVYVDDCLIAGQDLKQVNKTIGKMNEVYQLKKSDLQDFLGFQITQDINTNIIEVCSKKYIEKCLDEMDLSNCKPCDTPIKKYERLQDDTITTEPFKECLGKLLWINKFRPDISFATHYLCCVANTATDKDWKALKRTFRYLSGTKSLKFSFNKTDLNIRSFTDASHQDLPKGYSTGCTFIFVGSNLMIQFSRKQKLITTSTYESETVEVVRATKEIMYLQGILNETGLKQQQPAEIFTDCKILLYNLHTDLVSKRSKHFQTKIWFLKQCIGWDIIHVNKIDGEDNISDMGTKALDRIRFKKYLQYIFNHQDTITYLGRCDSLCKQSNYVKAPFNEKISKVHTLEIYNKEYERDSREDLVELLFYIL